MQKFLSLTGIGLMIIGIALFINSQAMGIDFVGTTVYTVFFFGGVGAFIIGWLLLDTALDDDLMTACDRWLTIKHEAVLIKLQQWKPETFGNPPKWQTTRITDYGLHIKRVCPKGVYW